MIIDFSAAILRLALALAFGAFIGVERELRQKHAGLKTMALVALGAAAFAMMSDTFGTDNHNPGQIAAAVVGGIGFIGAGVIMHRGATVQGVTTAATLWASASVGVALGLGQYALAVALTAGILIVQFVMRPFETKILYSWRRAAPGRFELRIDCDGEALPALNTVLARHVELVPLRRSVQRAPEHLTLRAVMRMQTGVDLTKIEEELVGVTGVRKVEIRHLGIDEIE
ncbi:MAG TPA: MgtC/SapB family protein [Thermoanaerobaculia bacterium]|nr:MgtC/SapB family protein [Thermoanaerobaculia bacterium]